MLTVGKTLFAVGLLSFQWGLSLAQGEVMLSTLASFDGTNAALPNELTLGQDGNLYGTTMAGGRGGVGTVFRMTPEGQLTTLASFNGLNGKWPNGKLVQDRAGSLYGTASQGGELGDGVVFKFSPPGTITPLVSFGDYATGGVESTNGSWPYALVRGSDGSLYGMTQKSGVNGPGTVFKITSQGGFETLASFKPGAAPAWLVKTPDGNSAVVGTGTKYQLAPLSRFTTLPGLASLGSLTLGQDGFYYGTDDSVKGGGKFFKMAPGGRLVNIPLIDGDQGKTPMGGQLLLAQDGNFYGITFAGNTNGTASGLGTIFKISPGGKLITLAVFQGTNGANPVEGLVQNVSGNIYGVTTHGGQFNSGTVFRLSNLPPPPRTPQ